MRKPDAVRKCFVVVESHKTQLINEKLARRALKVFCSLFIVINNETSTLFWCTHTYCFRFIKVRQ